mgnify:CR=1 FL=1
MDQKKTTKYFILTEEPTQEQIGVIENQTLETIPKSKDGNTWVLEYYGVGIPECLIDAQLIS